MIAPNSQTHRIIETPIVPPIVVPIRPASLGICPYCWLISTKYETNQNAITTCQPQKTIETIFPKNPRCRFSTVIWVPEGWRVSCAIKFGTSSARREGIKSSRSKVGEKRNVKKAHVELLPFLCATCRAITIATIAISRATKASTFAVSARYNRLIDRSFGLCKGMQPAPSLKQNASIR